MILCEPAIQTSIDNFSILDDHDAPTLQVFAPVGWRGVWACKACRPFTQTVLVRST